jgi:hypothetical protein
MRLLLPRIGYGQNAVRVRSVFRVDGTELFSEFSCLRIEIRVPHIKRLFLCGKSTLEGRLSPRHNSPMT